jgi:hypothetical protein
MTINISFENQNPNVLEGNNYPLPDQIAPVANGRQLRWVRENNQINWAGRFFRSIGVWLIKTLRISSIKQAQWETECKLKDRVHLAYIIPKEVSDVANKVFGGNNSTPLSTSSTAGSPDAGNQGQPSPTSPAVGATPQPQPQPSTALAAGSPDAGNQGHPSPTSPPVGTGGQEPVIPGEEQPVFRPTLPMHQRLEDELQKAIGERRNRTRQEAYNELFALLQKQFPYPDWWFPSVFPEKFNKLWPEESGRGSGVPLRQDQKPAPEIEKPQGEKKEPAKTLDWGGLEMKLRPELKNLIPELHGWMQAYGTKDNVCSQYLDDFRKLPAYREFDENNKDEFSRVFGEVFDETWKECQRQNSLAKTPGPSTVSQSSSPSKAQPKEKYARLIVAEGTSQYTLGQASSCALMALQFVKDKGTITSGENIRSLMQGVDRSKKEENQHIDPSEIIIKAGLPPSITTYYTADSQGVVSQGFLVTEGTSIEISDLSRKTFQNVMDFILKHQKTKAAIFVANGFVIGMKKEGDWVRFFDSHGANEIHNQGPGAYVISFNGATQQEEMLDYISKRYPELRTEGDDPKINAFGALVFPLA